MGELYDQHDEGDYQITHWKKSTEVLETVAGLIYYRDWCEMELDRLGKDNHYIEEITYPNDRHKYICIKRRDG